ncbi:Pex12 amino terminal region-domain-containing protein [Irpex lacteus]|nr:Pex12 amino terminal region-domain-containing protein [Irpex lacteus]
MSHASSSTSHWQRLWEEAQPRLGNIRQSLSEQSSPTPRITRVGKPDAELLDQELVSVLQEPVAKALNIVNSAFKARFEPELTLLIQLTLYKFSLWDSGASYGARLQGLKYVLDSSKEGVSSVSSLPRKLLLVHGAITLLVPYMHTRIRAHALSQAWPDAPSSDRRRKAWELLTRLESIHSLSALLNFVAFLWDGGYRTLTDRLLRMRLVSTQRLTSRDVSYEFMNRQMVWHAFTEFLLFLLPLINTRALSRRLNKFTSQITLSSLLPSPIRSACGIATRIDATKESRSRKGKYWSLSLDQCAICYEDASTNLNLTDSANALTSLANPTYSATSSSISPPDTTEGPEDEPPQHPLHTPYITDCGHVYCYVCITSRMIRTADDASGIGPGGTRWECLRCAEEVTAVDRLESEIERGESEYGSDDLSFDYGSEDVDYTDMSGSIGDYSESGESE